MKTLILTTTLLASLTSFAAPAKGGSNVGSVADQQFSSIYTSIKSVDCKVISSSELENEPDIDHLDMECSGAGEYDVSVSGGDLRYPLYLKFKNTDIKLTNFFSFHQVNNDIIEWRGPKAKNGNITYKALIYRMGIAGFDGADQKELMVVKLDGLKSCLVGRVKSSKTMNEQARKIADKADQLKCLNVDSGL